MRAPLQPGPRSRCRATAAPRGTPWRPLPLSFAWRWQPSGSGCLSGSPGIRNRVTANRVRYDDADSPYREIFQKSIARMEHDEQTLPGSSSPAQEGEISVRVPVGAGGKTLVSLLRLLPDQAVPALLQRNLPALIGKAAEENNTGTEKRPQRNTPAADALVQRKQKKIRRQRRQELLREPPAAIQRVSIFSRSGRYFCTWRRMAL